MSYMVVILSSCAAKREIIKTVVETPESTSSVAILDFENNSPNINWDYMKKAIPDILSAKLAANQNIKVVEREKLQKIIDELKLSMTGVISNETAQKVGKIIGVDILVFGSFTKLGKSIVIVARIIDVETAEVISGATVHGEDEEQLAFIVDELTTKVSALIE